MTLQTKKKRLIRIQTSKMAFKQSEKERKRVQVRKFHFSIITFCSLISKTIYSIHPFTIYEISFNNKHFVENMNLMNGGKILKNKNSQTDNWSVQLKPWIAFEFDSLSWAYLVAFKRWRKRKNIWSIKIAIADGLGYLNNV